MSAKNTALIRVAVELTDAESTALTRALERRFGHALQLQVELDTRIMGGVWVQVGDTIIDGSVQGRLEALRHHLRASSREMILGSGQSWSQDSDNA
jgi:F-type H+-transporting ATPase subunit delta